MIDRALNTKDTGTMIGGLNSRDVCLLIRDGKLRAKRLVVRGRGGRPRYLVMESEISRYLEQLEDANSQAVKGRTRKIRRGNLADVIEFV